MLLGYLTLVKLTSAATWSEGSSRTLPVQDTTARKLPSNLAPLSQIGIKRKNIVMMQNSHGRSYDAGTLKVQTRPQTRPQTSI